MGLFSRWRRDRAAKAYAKNLGSWLVKNFGGGDSYTPQQIKRGIREFDLDPRYVVFAYARFLDEEYFDALYDSLPFKLAYHEARDLMDHYTPVSRRFDSQPDHNYRRI